MKIIRNQQRSLGKSRRVYVWCGDQSFVQVDKRKHVRCPTCGRRLLAREVPGGFKVPPHKYAKKEH